MPVKNSRHHLGDQTYKNFNDGYNQMVLLLDRIERIKTFFLTLMDRPRWRVQWDLPRTA